MYSVILFKLKRGENIRKKRKSYRSFDFSKPNERECDFSLGLRSIRPSEFFWIRRKVALRGEAYAWVSILRSFNKLREVGVSSYLSFTFCLSVFMMLELVEAVSCRLIGLKSWNRIVRKF